MITVKVGDSVKLCLHDVRNMARFSAQAIVRNIVREFCAPSVKNSVTKQDNNLDPVVEAALWFVNQASSFLDRTTDERITTYLRHIGVHVPSGIQADIDLDNRTITFIKTRRSNENYCHQEI